MTRASLVRAAVATGMVGTVALAYALAPSPSLVRPAEAGEATAIQDAFPGVTFENPVCVASPDDGTDRLFVVERKGTIEVLKKWRGAGPAPAKKLFLDLSALQDPEFDSGQGGLLTLAFHPQFRANGRFFVFYGSGRPYKAVVASYKVSAADPDSADPASGQIVLALPKDSKAHYGGGLAFGPDGRLYVGFGAPEIAVDPAKPKDQDYWAQDTKRLDGKILRIDVDGAAPYGVPRDNPWAAAGQGIRPEIFAYGCRNPWRISFDREKGGLWMGDPGQRRREEIDLVPRAGNMGWSYFEGSLPLLPLSQPGSPPPDYVPPVLDYGRDNPSAVPSGKCCIGGVVYRGQRCPAWRGWFVFGEFSDGKVFAFPTDGARATGAAKLVGDVASIASVSEDAQGELYFCALDDGKVMTLVPAP